ncbi:hypothetical protein BKP37_00185 [Anaerobacillus alkalilacustris]|uniref:DUF2232 domain-containing protein n=1 Tax=Anaerobacillus alkalilacustris TaxID=393763 RepID=A0A1S2LZ57_9BACI|nr:DUF2232 domain-containing protein [Anaerobacillus alkalilacustris]OIJ17017.1 hypothetical protein BKP37_00185 [Anaerobacillus alkalilacustris]
MKNTKVMTEGAIFAAIFALIAFTTVILPILGSILIWILPLPFIIYTLRNGWKPGLLLFFVASFVSFIIGGPLLIFSAIFFGSGGLVVGELFRRKKSAFTVLLGGSLAYIVNLLFYFILSILIFDIHPVRATQELMIESINAAEAMLLALGQDPSAQLAHLVDFTNQLIVLAPSIIISTGAFYALFIQLISYAVLKRIGMKVPKFKPFREWSFPKSFLWYYLVASILMIIGLQEGTALHIVMWNLFPLLEIVMTIQGLAVVFYYCYAKRLNKSIPIIIIIITIIAPFLLYIYRILGIIDLGFELRKRMKNSK